MSSAVADFVQTLRALPLLTAAQQQQLDGLAQKWPDAKALGEELIRRGWLTAYQANQIVKGKAQNLTLDQYVLLDLLGQGGMGAVFKARQSRMQRLVALKIIKREAMSSPAAVERFKREAIAAARLSHPNIVTVFDSGEAKGVHYLVMEYIEGTDLSKLVKQKGPLGVSQACEYIRQAALGLQHAHEQGLVHRDIKPHNLMLIPLKPGSAQPQPGSTQPKPGSLGTGFGTIKIMDMGLARLAASAEAAQTSEGLTGTGAVLGTADYIAPEQAMNAKRVDIRADIYSLGCTLYHLLTGRPPFAGESLTEKLLKHQMEDPEPVEEVRQGLPIPLATVVRTMMARKPDDRYSTPAEVATALEPFAKSAAGAGSGTEIVARGATITSQAEAETIAPGGMAQSPTLDASPARPRGKRTLVLSVGLLGVLVVGVAIMTAMSSSSPSSQAKASRAAPATARPAGTKRTPQPETKPEIKPPDPPVEPKPLPGKSYLDNSIGMKLVLIPAGKFTMGSPDSEKDRFDDREGPQHEVEIARPFYMGIHEVTQDEYEKVMNATPSRFKAVNGQDTKRFPVEQVSWDEATDFCRKLSEMPDEKNAGRTYRLPTEAEWEYACRAATKTVFHYGNSLSSVQANFNGESPYGGAAKGPFLQRTTMVGSYLPNAFGLYDMHGNVWEWCQDWYGPYTKEVQKDPRGPPTGSSRVLHGGSWDGGGRICRAAYRNFLTPGDRPDSTGFRVVMTQTTPPKSVETAPEFKPLPGKEYITNSIGMKLVKIPQGKFTMGSPDSETDRHPNEGPQHEVEITRPFYMGIYEVTQDEYEKVMKATPSQFKAVAGRDTKRFPVEQVSWGEATDFCRKLSEMPDELNAGRLYRLPTEAEWEYACRADTKTVFHYGNSLSSAQANFNGDSPYGGAAKGPFLQRTTTVGTYPPNAFGLHDMHGNVWEWCQDRFGPYRTNSQKDPQGPQTGSARVVRGGSWPSVGGFCRAAIRSYNAPDAHPNNFGFRVVMTQKGP